MIISLQLPFPPSKNALRKSGSGRVYLSKKYKDWKLLAGHEINRQKPGVIEGPFWCEMRFTRPDKRRRDVQNYPEPVMDLLQEMAVISDDCECQGLSIEWVAGDYECKVSIIPCERRG